MTLAFVLGAAAWCLLLNSLLSPGAYDRAAINLWFDSDVGRVVENMTIRESGHSSTFKHPLFSILLYPPTAALMLLGAGRDAALAVVLATNAALFVWAMDRLAHRAGLAPVDRAILLLTSLSAAGFMFWFPVPETFPFGATTMLVALLLMTGGPARGEATEPSPGPRVATWAVATVLSMSMTITNLLMLVAGAFDALWQRRRAPWPTLRAVLVGGVLGVGVAAVVAVMQDRLFGDAGLFFNPRALLGERQFVGGESASSTLERLQTLALQVMVAGEPVAPPVVEVGADGVGSTGLRADGAWPAGVVGMMAVAGWAVVLATACWHLVAGRDGIGVPAVVRVAGVFLILNVLLHLVYGSAVFLYTAHFVGPAVLVGAGTVLRAGRPLARLGVAAVALLSLASNLGAFARANALAQGALQGALGS